MLFNVRADELIDSVRDSGFGCYIGSILAASNGAISGYIKSKLAAGRHLG